jgi:hypothetical protein
VDLLERLLGLDDRRGGDGIGGLISSISRWIMYCGCFMALGVVALIALVVGGIINFGADAMTVIIVLATIVVAVISLLRTSLGY